MSQMLCGDNDRFRIAYIHNTQHTHTKTRRCEKGVQTFEKSTHTRAHGKAKHSQTRHG